MSGSPAAPMNRPGSVAALAPSRHRARRLREITTPDGMLLHVTLAERGERAIAVVIDLFLMGIAIVVASIAVGLLIAAIFGAEWSISLVILCSFAIRSLYFVFFELRWQGQTPGKRSMNIRVIDRGGGRLSADAIFARNLMRELELYLPMSLLFSSNLETSGWINLFTAIWLGIFLLMPFFNRDSMRVGDIVGGTWVVAAPASVLYSDLASSKASATESPYQFSKEQLGVYGVYELQTLEAVLRKRGSDARDTRVAVYDRISRKIGWLPDAGQTVNAGDFLDAYYRALRAHLETGMLFGKRRESKHDAAP